ncbi:hypothetical protein VP01_13183g1 [Puccinia sorghi]|uniref:Uncharacterized protein n=1 Tax=Puccinia sorghi TaxID=27349 RepID=A0A0L6VMZ4_9BASI|nr:hypothetical protein VP01_13183g1 [Puccinia sorghi]
MCSLPGGEQSSGMSKDEGGEGGKAESKDEGGEGGKAEGALAKLLTYKQIKCHAYKANFQKERRLNANLKLSGISHIPVHISNTNPNSMICFFNKSFIDWADQSQKKIIAIVKFYPFSTMDLFLKSGTQRLNQHLIAQTAYQNPNQSNGP